MKKILILFASPHKNGKTKKLLSLFIESFENQFEINFFDAYKESILPCVDCGKCSQTGYCKFNDLNRLNSNLKSCDIIVIASPIYNLSFPAPFKSILDRLQLYYNFYLQNGHCKFEKKKEVILLLTCGRKCDNFVVNMLEKQLNFILKYLNAKVFSKIVWDETDASLELSQNIWQEIRKITNSLIDKKD